MRNDVSKRSRGAEQAGYAWYLRWVAEGLPDPPKPRWARRLLKGLGVTVVATAQVAAALAGLAGEPVSPMRPATSRRSTRAEAADLLARAAVPRGAAVPRPVARRVPHVLRTHGAPGWSEPERKPTRSA
jgi:hypothetical protein